MKDPIEPANTGCFDVAEIGASLPDTPRRDPKDVIFVNPEDGTPESFIQAVQ